VKEAYYFPHDSNARNDERMINVRLKYKMEGYGIYFAIIERLRESDGYMGVRDYNNIAFDLRVDTSVIKSIIEDFGLFVFTDDGKYFYSESLTRRMQPLENQKRQRENAGKKSAEKRWKGKKVTAVKRSLQNPVTTVTSFCNKEEESIEEKIKEISPDGDTKKNSDEFSCVCPDFQKFNDWLHRRAPYCANEKNFARQITEGEFLRLKQKFTGQEIADVIEQIENRKDLRKRYVNLYLTVLNWAKREYENR
jgi:hypothetical protein